MCRSHRVRSIKVKSRISVVFFLFCICFLFIMRKSVSKFVILCCLLNLSVSYDILSRNFMNVVSSKRKFLAQTLVSLPFLLSNNPIAARAESTILANPYELRDRNYNKQAIIRDDIWYLTGQLPPRRIDLTDLPKGPKWNAWGACSSSDSTGNSCTYVSLKQKIPAYSNYAFSISLGAKTFEKLGVLFLEMEKKGLNLDNEWSSVSLIVHPTESTSSPILDCLRKMVLFASAMLTSPNYTGPPFELLIARFYVNEFSFAMDEITKATEERDLKRATDAWAFGRDSFNSYFTIVNKAIVPKVGDRFAYIQNNA